MNETKFDIRRMKEKVSYNRKAFMHLTRGLKKLEKKQEKCAKELQELDRAMSEKAKCNDAELDEMLALKQQIDAMNQRHIAHASEIIATINGLSQKDAGTNAIDRKLLQNIIQEKEYIDSYPLLKELLRTYLLVASAD